MSDPYRTLARPQRHEIQKIKGSRFIGSAEPFLGETELALRIDALRAEFPAANHHCYAWRRGADFRYSDDGEPSGSAGRPILQRIDGAKLDHAQVIVTRIFGGTKLGTGGLARAYSSAALEVLAGAAIREVIPSRMISINVPYVLEGAVQSVALARGMTPHDSSFGESVTHWFDVPLDAVEGFLDDIRERTAGRAVIA